ncbi:hypothetical protein N5D52_13750 [Pseudomonas sp. GD03860]|uniref:hypothetical protein n=1 Tax=Pseudomonas TaxID=286 RepID=UPI0023639858|nr:MULTISPECIES: hypothetical protein [Pseudomonas]MDD2056792.1 hypothetical protein [Pseudomonas putida]MDH0638011.1 hypothetical protein [Pseudomonas sp. GD03860]
MLNFNKPLALPSQLEWKFAHEPELLSWTIRARNYNTFVANCMFAFMSVVLVGLSYFLYSTPAGGEGVLPRLIASLCFYIIFSLVVASMTHQRMNFAFRLTHSGVEYCKWKDFPKWALTFLKWLTGITAIFFVFMAVIDPSLLLGALIGPGGLALTYLSMANSKSYQEMQTEYHHHEFKWDEFTQLAIATNREVVDLKYSVILEGDDFVTRWSLNIFCKRKQKEKVAELIRPYLSPGVPFIKAKVNVPLSTD